MLSAIDGHFVSAILGQSPSAQATTLTLKNISIYTTQGDMPNSVGLSEMLQWRNQVAMMAKDQGFTELIIQGERVLGSTSANPGKVVNIPIPLSNY